MQKETFCRCSLHSPPPTLHLQMHLQYTVAVIICKWQWRSGIPLLESASLTQEEKPFPELDCVCFLWIGFARQNANAVLHWAPQCQALWHTQCSKLWLAASFRAFRSNASLLSLTPLSLLLSVVLVCHPVPVPSAVSMGTRHVWPWVENCQNLFCVRLCLGCSSVLQMGRYLLDTWRDEGALWWKNWPKS